MLGAGCLTSQTGIFLNDERKDHEQQSDKVAIPTNKMASVSQNRTYVSDTPSGGGVSPSVFSPGISDCENRHPVPGGPFPESDRLRWLVPIDSLHVMISAPLFRFPRFTIP
jgi:hypothetical protein